MSAALDQVRQKVQNILTAHFQVGLDHDGDFTIRFDSAVGYVRVWEQEATKRVLVRLQAALLLDVPPTPELFEYVARHADDFVFGHLSVADGRDGKVLVLLSHQLLGDYLDEAELVQAVIAVAAGGDDLDDKLQAQFGGVRYIEG